MDIRYNFAPPTKPDNVAPLVAAAPAIAKGIGALLKKVNLKELGKITEGIIDKKLAAGIAAGHALGYSDQQLRTEPLYSIVAAIGQFPYTIAAVVNDPRPLFQRIANERGISLPKPELNAFPYVAPCGAGTAWCGDIPKLIAPIFGEGVASLSQNRQTITSLPAASSPGITEPVSARIQNESQQRTQLPPPDQSVLLLKPLIPAMDAGLKAVGQIPPTSLEAKAQLFYDKVVVPSGGGAYSLDEDIVEAIISFVAAKAAKKQAGEEQSEIYDKIGAITLNVQDKIGQAAKTKVDQKIGGFLTNNIPLFILAIVALFAFAGIAKNAK